MASLPMFVSDCIGPIQPLYPFEVDVTDVTVLSRCDGNLLKKKTLNTVCLTKPTRPNTMLKGTSTAAFNESPHHPSFVISVITRAAGLKYHAASAFTFIIN